MVANANYVQEGELLDYTPVIAVVAGDIIQLSDGRAAFAPTAIAAAIKGAVQVCGLVTMPKTTSMALLDGGKAFWDYSASKVHFRKVNDRDFYLGRVVGDCTEASTSCVVALNVSVPYDVDVHRDAFLSVATGTKVVGVFGFPKVLGGSNILELGATSEAQCIDLLSVDKFAVAANPIAEFIFRVPTNGTGSTVDFNIGMANGTSATDADVITESCFVHIDGGSVNVLAESDDGTTEVAATDTTADITAGTAVANRVEVWMDARNPADVQIYVEGVLVLASTVFALTVAAGPLGLLAHLEKTTGTETGIFAIDEMRVRLMKQ
jgi:predicted RecA/RadA family phage recombinase